jgi:RNA ligase (TIGR02306 family)
MRKLASIKTISNIQPIEGADVIELATVDSWNVVVAKDVGHKIGDMVIYCEIDSFLPIREEFEFLRKSSYKKMGDQEGFRLKTIRLRGQVSQGLILPISVLNPEGTNIYIEPFEGLDVTDMLDIVKYEPPIPAQLSGIAKGLFPSFIRKTDEERVQNLTREYEGWRLQSQHQFYVTEKLDGSSATFFFNNGAFGVCSRNLELAEPEPFVEGETIIGNDGVERPKQENSFWKVARHLQLKEWLSTRKSNYAIQGELIGEGIQGNPYKIKGQTVRFFNAFNIDTQQYLSLPEFEYLIKSMGLETVPILDRNFTLPNTVDEMLKYAEDKSILNPQFDREGVVIRSIDRTISFKAISNKFLLKHQ